MALNWNEQPELMLLDEVVAITRHSIRHAYNLLQRRQFPIAHLPDVIPYRFPKDNVRVWVESATVTNPAARIKRFARRKPRAAHQQAVS